MRPAGVITKKRDDEPETHYLIGPQRETREAAADDLTLWRLLESAPPETLVGLTPEDIDAAMANLRTLLERHLAQGLSIRAGRTPLRGEDGTRKGRLFIVIQVQDGLEG